MSAPIKSRQPRFRVVRDTPRLCSNCTHGYLGDAGVLCRPLNELITNETVAAQCELYEEPSEGTAQ